MDGAQEPNNCLQASLSGVDKENQSRCIGNEPGPTIHIGPGLECGAQPGEICTFKTLSFQAER
jgi:hypothetical protein